MTTTATSLDLTLVDRYTALWNEPDAELRRRAIAELWTADGVEYVEGARFTGHDELDTRVAEAYNAFVADGRYRAANAADAHRHDDLLTFTIQLIGVETGEIAWAARIFLLLDAEDKIREDYQLTVQPLDAQ
ncbi:hypothetical protein ACIP5Y_37090 [Nocardia sp. NPDC088792]|uniref:hypothetical protein n=1 Tax=Nocardia sp. NPDC088792 TaxID=3364332 RepID=UPI003817FB27